MKITQDFGGIYKGNNPTHGVYVAEALQQHGNKAVAVSHHWSEKSASETAASETVIKGRACVVVEYEILAAPLG
jgi:hypothetical protein